MESIIPFFMNDGIIHGMEREKEFKRHDWMRKIIYFLLSFFTYGISYMAMTGIVLAVNLLFPIPVYIRLSLYILFFFLARFLTVRIMNLKTISTFLLQL